MSFTQQDYSEIIMRLVIVWSRLNDGLKLCFGLGILFSRMSASPRLNCADDKPGLIPERPAILLDRCIPMALCRQNHPETDSRLGEFRVQPQRAPEFALC